MTGWWYFKFPALNRIILKGCVILQLTCFPCNSKSNLMWCLKLIFPITDYNHFALKNLRRLWRILSCCSSRILPATAETLPQNPEVTAQLSGSQLLSTLTVTQAHGVRWHKGWGGKDLGKGTLEQGGRWGWEGSLQGVAVKQQPDKGKGLHADFMGAQKTRDQKQEGAPCVTDLREGKVNWTQERDTVRWSTSHGRVL